MSGNDHFVALVVLNILGLAGIIIWHLQGRSRPTGRLIVQILFFAGMCLVLGLYGISPSEADAVYREGIGALLSKSARILWWTHLAWTAIGFLHLYLMLNRRPREAHLLQDMIVGAVYLGVGLSIVGFVFGAPIGTLVATSGVVAIIFGLALQNTLSDVFSGIALTLGHAYAIGDWVQLGDGTEGRVIETNWRSTNLLTGAHNVVVLPNSILAKQSMTNLSRPDETHSIGLTVRIAAIHPPELVEESLLNVLKSSRRIVSDPPPSVALKAIDAVALEIELQFRVENPMSRMAAKNEIIRLVYAHCRMHHISLALPAASVICTLPASEGTKGRDPGALSPPDPEPNEMCPSTASGGFPATRSGPDRKA